jgi:cytochrome c5
MRRLAAPVFFFLWIAGILISYPVHASAGEMAFSQAAPTPEPEMPPLLNRLAPPPTVYPPTQADQGAQVYYLVCMACHGDRGQGLTDEWRGALGPGDMNCWQAHCHASNHPVEGFKLPKYIPPVISPTALSGFGNALILHDYIEASMPWQAPGRLTDEEYWQLTAYLIRENGIEIGIQPLNPQNAGLFDLRDQPSTGPEPTIIVARSQPSSDDGMAVFAGTAILIIVLAISIIWWHGMKRG